MGVTAKRVFLSLEKKPPTDETGGDPAYHLAIILGGADKPVCQEDYANMSVAQSDLAEHADNYAAQGYQVNIWEDIPKPDTVMDWLAALPTRTLLYELKRRGTKPTTKAGNKGLDQIEKNLLASLEEGV